MPPRRKIKAKGTKAPSPRPKKKKTTRRPPKAPRQTFTDKEIQDALKETGGFVFLAARAVGCDVETVRKRARNCPGMRELIQSRHFTLADMAEGWFKLAVQTGQQWAVEKALDALMRETYGKPAPRAESGPESAAPAVHQQNVFVLSQAEHLPLSALRALVDAVRGQKLGLTVTKEPPFAVEGPPEQSGDDAEGTVEGLSGAVEGPLNAVEGPLEGLSSAVEGASEAAEGPPEQPLNTTEGVSEGQTTPAQGPAQCGKPENAPGHITEHN